MSRRSDHHTCPSAATIFLDRLHSFELTINSGQLLRPTKSAAHLPTAESWHKRSEHVDLTLKVTTIFFDAHKLEFKWQNRLQGLVLISLHFFVKLCLRSWEGVKAQSMAILEADKSSAKVLR